MSNTDFLGTIAMLDSIPERFAISETGRYYSTLDLHWASNCETRGEVTLCRKKVFLQDHNDKR